MGSRGQRILKKDAIVFLLSLTTERLCRLTSNFLSRNITDMLSKPPTVPKWVKDLPMTVTPELVLQGLQNGGTRIDGTFPKRFDIFRGEVQDNRSATDRQW